MDGARLSRFPHLAWLHFSVAADAARNPLVVGMQGACHTISLTASGHHDIRCIRGGSETRWSEDAGAVHFQPADDEHRTFVTVMSPNFVSQVLLLPRQHLETYLRREEFDPRPTCRRILASNDVILTNCMRHLVDGGRYRDSSRDGATDAHARRLVLRLVEFSGGGMPDWHDDESTFDSRTIASLTEHVDAHLRIGSSLSELAVRVGLSPSHFARKFRACTGLSLHRFVNRRRLEAALRLLRDHREPLTGVAVDLGFSSQSHLTRLFSSLTGMTPAKYRKQFARVTA
ncbi:MAG: helix-turn-helix transcriptional regulator [Planctomycetaceae bacterium]